MRGRFARPYLAAAGLLVALPPLALAGYILFAFLTLPPLGGAVLDQGQRALTVEADDGRVFATRGAFRGQPITKAELPAHRAEAIVAIEDRRFFSHWGIDLRGLVRAARRNAAGGGVREGGATITQQYVRLTSLNQEKTLRRKIQEAFLALRVESEMSEDEILLGYRCSRPAGRAPARTHRRTFLQRRSGHARNERDCGAGGGDGRVRGQTACTWSTFIA